MKFPSIGDYLSSIISGSDFFATLTSVEPVLGVDGEPIFYSGNFGVVFKVNSSVGTKAVKCFTREQSGRSDAYRKICLGMPVSNYIVPHRYLSGEILAGARGENLSTFDVLDMEWVEGLSLMGEIERCCKDGDVKRLELLSANFDAMALWLLGQDFGHGDIKPDNIIVMRNGDLKFIDYDGLYMPSMKGQPQREYGTVGFQHPLRGSMVFDKAIDNYSLATLSLTLRALGFAPEFFGRFAYKEVDGLLFSPTYAVGGRSSFINFLKTTPLGDLALMSCVESAEPDFAGLDRALSERLDCDKSVLSCRLTPVRSGGKFGYVDGKGVERIEALYDCATQFGCGYAAVKLGEWWGYIDIRGRAQTGFVYDNAWSFGEQNLAMVKYKGKYGFVDLSFNMAIGSTFDYAAPFSEGLAVASIDGKYGYIDHNGQWAVAPIYDYASSFHNGVAKVERDGLEAIIER